MIYCVNAGPANCLFAHYRGFLQKQTDRFQLVFLVLGNHKFYKDTFAAGLERAR